MRAIDPTVGAVVFIAAVFALAATFPSARSGDEPKQPADKAGTSSLDERYAKVVAGVRKLKEAEVVALLGPAHTMKRPVPEEKGQPAADRELGWELSTRIIVHYKDGRVKAVSGVFSEYLPVERVTPDTFRRVQVGLTKKEVVEILGETESTVELADGVGDRWGAAWSIKLGLDKNGLLVHQQRTGSLYAPRKQ